MRGASVVRGVLVVWAVVLTGCWVPRLGSVNPSPDHRAILFKNVAVFTPDGAIQGQDVLVRGRLIESVAPTSVQYPDDVRVVDGRGKTLLPGLIDMHAHLLVY